VLSVSRALQWAVLDVQLHLLHLAVPIGRRLRRW
jgi:hypothetical protein